MIWKFINIFVLPAAIIEGLQHIPNYYTYGISLFTGCFCVFYYNLGIRHESRKQFFSKIIKQMNTTISKIEVMERMIRNNVTKKNIQSTE